MNRVAYTGGTESYRQCQPASDLKEGVIYNVLVENIGDFQTNYELQGMPVDNSLTLPGYNSVWFKPVYRARAFHRPVKGRRLYDFIREAEYGWEAIEYSSRIIRVKHLWLKRLYIVETLNSIYFVKLSLVPVIR